ncbi:hypothetical protein LEN26_002757 [Aphanomyces euteiches]|nr:hypothetical protein AeMF1_004488 [Aphanomyces euteiches]KAH9158735.1 hypothetical protein LEN26_002757 [Aphanomyces euteiches]KAH9185780.1 hypothetical protein AeNC1_012242 [Aphanomyces euteiches]
MDPRLVGTWESTEAFGNTALDWSQDVKDGVATLRLSFAADGHVGFQVDGPKNYAHALPADSTCECNTGDKRLTMHGDKTGLAWFYQVEDDMTLRLRLVGAKRFARCNGVDNIYFKRTTTTDS